MANGYAVINNNVVSNVIVIEPEIAELKGSAVKFGGELIALTDNAGIGWGYDGSSYTPPVESEPTPEQKAEDNQAMLSSLLVYAKSHTDDWRTELALGIISDSDKAKLTEWMQYIKALNATDIAEQEINWPEKPS